MVNSTFCHSGMVLAGIQEEKNGSSGILQSSSWAMTMWFLWLV
ncbi:hypothetical protein ASZ90_008492 [hydrocarbon metagenome]|uniref:Uncharacterized protein n=1 Tax=hydrocarbon metagenome TaxID=938273 RepID=A0A0W8FLM2_9ZZZZ